MQMTVLPYLVLSLVYWLVFGAGLAALIG